MERSYSISYRSLELLFTDIVPRDFPVKTPSAPTVLQVVEGFLDVDPRILAKAEIALIAAALGYLWSRMSRASIRTPAIVTGLGIVGIFALPAEEPAATITTFEQQAISKPKFSVPTAQDKRDKYISDLAQKRPKLVEGPDFVLRRGADGVIRYS